MSAYNKLLKKGSKSPGKGNNNNRITTQSEDSDTTERTPNQNVFLDSSQQYIVHDSRMQRNPTSSKAIIAGTNNKLVSKSKQKQKQYSTKQQNMTKNQIQLVDDEQIPQGQQQSQQSQSTSSKVQQNASLSILASYKYYTGQLTHNIKYPFSKIIAINNNNSQENIMSKRQLKARQRQQNSSDGDDKLSQTRQFYFTNGLKVSWLLVVWHVLMTVFSTCWEWYLYIGVMVTSFIVQRFVFFGNAQYVGDPYILLVVAGVYLIGRLLVEWLMIKNRRNFDDDREKFKVYFHDGVSAEWNMLQADQIMAGHVYKVPSGSKFPTDAILLHSTKSILLIDQKQTKTFIPQSIFTSTIKQTIIKTPTIILPISGMLEYTILSPEQNRTSNWFEGSLRLEQPIALKHNVSVDNVVYRNSINISSCEVLCMALEVGVSSLNLKNVQYPHLWKDSEGIFDRCSQILTIKKFASYFVVVACIGYFVMGAIGLLVGYLANGMTKNHYYLGQQVKVLHLLFYHFTNFVIFIPVLCDLSILLYTYLMGKLTQSNISSRRFQFSQTDIDNSISHNCGTITIKDYSIIPYLTQPTTLVAGIDIFKEKKTFVLKKIIVKETKFQFETQNIQDDLFQDQQKNIIRSFMTVTLLTTTGFSSKTQNISFESSIRKMAKDHFSLKLNQQKELYSVTGPLENVFSQGKLEVIPYFTIKGCKQHPYMISFYEIPAQKNQQNAQRRVLCLLRGDPQTVLMKAYGKKINLLSQSMKLHQEYGYQMQFVGKFTIFFSEAQNLKDSYQSATIQKNKFYQLLDPLIKKIQPMGLLAFQNQFSQSMISSTKVNPFLNLSTTSPPPPTPLSSHHLPNLILICPSPDSSCLHPQLESVNTINRILGNSLLFNFTKNEIGEKILYDPIPVEEMVEKLTRERVVVLTGWEVSNVVGMLDRLKEKGVVLTGVVEKDQELYLAKVCDYSVSSSTTTITTKPQGDTNKYTDIHITLPPTTSKTTTFLSIIQLINHDSHITYNRLQYIILVHIIKFICYFIVEGVNFYFTLGTGVSLVRLPLYVVTEVIILGDVGYFLNVKDGVEVGQEGRKLPNVLGVCVKTIVLCLVGTMIIVFSSVTPHTIQATPTNSTFCLLHIHLFITHLIIFSKLSFTRKISFYQLLILTIQLGSYYIGILIISEVSLYQFNHVLMYMFGNKLYLVSVVCVWVYLTVGVGEVVWRGNKENGEGNKKENHSSNKYQQIKRLNKETNLEIIQIQEDV